MARGEDALLEASASQFDVITMDHFMAIDEMNGDETIRRLRGMNTDAAIIGISGNKKEDEHIEAGADAFFQKPLPSNQELLESLTRKLAPPAGWKVLVLCNFPSLTTLLVDRLYRVSSSHYTTHEEAAKRWTITALTSIDSVEKARELVSMNSYDLVVDVEPTELSKAPPNEVRLYLR